LKVYNYLTSIVMICISISILLYAIFFLPGTSIQYDIGPTVFPIVISILALILSSGLILITLKSDDSTLLKELFNKDSFIKVLASIVIFSVYLFIISVLGFVISTLLFLYGYLSFLGVKSVIKCLLISIITTFSIYIIFNIIFSVQLPSGIFI